MRIVAVTACANGIAQTYMAAEQLERAAKRLGHSIKVETQGAVGVENELTQADVDAADGIIIASDIAIERDGRFRKARRVAQVPVQIAMRDPDSIFARL
jgi:PTS system fructose-specific IIB component/fructose-specific PTS system IIB-like component